MCCGEADWERRTLAAAAPTSLMTERKQLISAHCVSNSQDGSVHVWELHTSARVCVLRQCGCRGRQQVALAAGGACLAAAQPDKPAVHLFWGAKEQAVYRCPCPEIMTCCLFGAQDTLLFAGGQSGCLYVWEVHSGCLLARWEGHFKAVTALRLSSDGCLLVSCAEDSLIHVWDVTSVVSSAVDAVDGTSVGKGHGSAAPSFSPLHSFGDHSLPVTDVFLAQGTLGRTTLMLSVSKDRTCKLYDLASLSTLWSVTLPVSLESVCANATFSTAFLGASDGRIFSLQLHPFDPASRASGMLSSGLTSSSSGRSWLQPSLPASSEGPQHVSSASSSSSSSGTADGSNATIMLGHSGPVVSLSSQAGEDLLVSASADGTVRLWEVASGQSIKTYRKHKGPVAGVQVLFTDAASFSHKSTTPPFKPLLRHAPILNEETTVPCFPQRDSLRDQSLDPVSFAGASERVLVDTLSMLPTPTVDGGGATPASGSSSSSAQEEVQRLQQEIQELKATNAELYAMVVEASSGGAPP